MRTQTKSFPQRLATSLAAGLLALPVASWAGSPGALSGAATLIRPELSSLSVTETVVEVTSQTNAELIAVGQIPVLATNIDYQLIFSNSGPVNIYYDTLILTNSPILSGGPYVCSDLMITNVASYQTNVVTDIIAVGQIPVFATNIAYQLVITSPDVINIIYDTLILTNATGTPFPGAPVGPYFCTDVTVTNIVGTETNVTIIGTTCSLSNNPTVLVIATNTILPQVQYYTLVTTNAFFDPTNPACWQTIYHTNTTTLTISETNLVKIGTTCILSNSLRTVSIVTNDILASLQYSILATTNLVFDPDDPRCWQTVYQTNLTITTDTSTNTTVTEFNFTFAGSENARGSVTLEQNGNRQSFSVVGRDLLQDANNPPAALGVFIGNSILNVNWQLVGIMDKAGTNNLYRLDLSSANGAPPTLGVTDVGDLAGMLVQIRDQATNVYAQAVIPKLAPVPKALSYSRTVKMQRPTPTPSPRASGKIRVKYNAQTGASFLDVSVRKLAGGNIYCALYTGNPVPDTSGCTDGLTLVNGNGFDRYDTSKGQDLPFGVGNYIATVEDLAGLHLFVIDAFGNIHLSGVIPGP
ncbi:MAG: hypothetical protein PCFJNLEI_02751 [Verrucomicrobiae bacterium]|nr:hypothetical protein [Verrucomicrobiae bacterium]